MAFIIPYLPGQ